VSERLRRGGGVRGGAAAPPRGVQGGGPPRGGSGAAPPKKKIFLGRHIFAGFGRRHISGPTYFRDHMILGGFRHMVFADGFLFPVKELGFWTNPGHWVRVLDAAGSYMYIVL
jgi:hypothetical protein